jgi:hypothetical protein
VRVSASSITAVTPAGTGTNDVVVTNPDGQFGTKTGGFTYAAAPTVTSVAPIGGPLAGNTLITITGTGFVSGATVKVGGTAATSVVFGSATSITARTPAGTAGAKAVVVTNPDTQASNSTVTFTYAAAPTVTSLTPTSGTRNGGTSITITGTGFVAGATVTIGGATCTSPSVVSPTSLTCTTGAHGLANNQTLVVTNPDGQIGSRNNAYNYT